MKNIVSIPLLLITLNFFACTEKNSAPVSADLSSYTIVDHPGGQIQKAIAADSNGKVTEEGEVLNGAKTGAWISYYPSEGRVKRITNYINGKKNGLHMTFSGRGHVELQCFYTEDQLDGPYMTFRNSSRKKIETTYKMGVLNGKYIEYNDRNNKILKEMVYNNGKLDGQFKQYNDEGILVMEYQYKDGEKISGGIVKDGPGQD